MGITLRDELLAAAVRYADAGWRVIPVDRAKKRPVMKDWQKLATTDVDQIAAWWEMEPDSNVGVCMGPTSGLIDIECDSEEGEQSLAKLFGIDEGQQWPITPTFISGSGRGKHRLFKYRAGLPNKANRNWNGIDFKLGVDDKGSMSIFPPSVHGSGGRYAWLPGLSPEECDVADLPDRAFAAIWNICEGESPETAPAAGKKRPKEHWEKVLKGVGKGERNESMVSLAGKFLRMVADLSDKESMQTAWMAFQAVNAQNAPPLDEKELKTIFLSIHDKEVHRRASEEFAVTTPTREVLPGEGEKPAVASDLKLVIVGEDPPYFELYAPQFAHANGGKGCIILMPEDMMAPNLIRRKAMEQALVGLSTAFCKAWHKPGGLFETLMAQAEHREGDVDMQRASIIAGRLLDVISQATPAVEDKMSRRGFATRMSDGSVLFHVSSVLDDLRHISDKITRHELYLVLQQCGVGELRVQEGGSRRRLRRATPEGIRLLEIVASGEKRALAEV